MDNTPDIEYVMYVGTTPEKLWEALTHSDTTRQYWGGRRIESDWQVGSPVNNVNPNGNSDWSGEVLQSDRSRLLSYTFNPPAFGHSSKVTFELQHMGETVRLTMTHAGVGADNPARSMTIEGWRAILSSLKTLLETGKPLIYSFWKG